MVHLVSKICNLCLVVVGAIYLFLCPYSKVEESFNLQGIHDILQHGIFPPSKILKTYDHMEFPGVVPRTFFGALMLAIASKPIKFVIDEFHINTLYLQYAVRGVLMMFILMAMFLFKHAISRKFGQDTGNYFVLITAAQFHFNFYLSRTLPNTFALFFALLAYREWIQSHMGNVIILLTFTTVVFRGDTIVLFVPIILESLLLQKISILRVILYGTYTSILSLLFTILLDSYFWQRWLWPEGEVLYFNTILNKSHEWGVMPWFWYFSSALPRSLLLVIPLIPIGLLAPGSNARFFSIDLQMAQFLIPIIIYVILFSFLPHKELRFIFNAIPIFNLSAALGLAKLYRSRKKHQLMYLFGMGCLITTFLISQIFLAASIYNYPGGVAFQRLHEIYQASNLSMKSIHIDSSSAMTGVSRFGEINRPYWRYSKNESLKSEEEYLFFDILLTADAERHKKYFIIREVIEIFNGLDYQNLRIKTRPHTYIMERKK